MVSLGAAILDLSGGDYDRRVVISSGDGLSHVLLDDSVGVHKKDAKRNRDPLQVQKSASSCQ